MKTGTAQLLHLLDRGLDTKGNSVRFTVVTRVFVGFTKTGRDSAVGVATGYGAGRPTSQCSSPGRGTIYVYPLHVVQTCSRVHIASYTMGTGDPFPGDEAPGLKNT
jgi:hypothetical protein